MKDHIISAIITFISTFLTTFGALFITVDVAHLDKSVIFALILSAVNTAIRSTIKVTFTTPPAPVDGQ